MEENQINIIQEQLDVFKAADPLLIKKRGNTPKSPAETSILKDQYLDLGQKLEQELIESGIPKEVHHLLGYRRVSKQEAKQLVGYCLSGWVVPFKDPEGKAYLHKNKPFCRIKPDPGQLEDAKYLSPKDGGCKPYFSPLLPKNALKPLKRLFITEGEKKTDCLTHHGFPTIGLSGVDCWRDKRTTGLLPELDRISWNKREVLITFDSDVTTKTAVQHALESLGNALVEKGAEVKVVLLPCEIDGSKNGPDDFIYRHGSAAFKQLTEIARPYKNWHPEPKRTHHKALTAISVFKTTFALRPLNGLHKWTGTHWNLLEEKPSAALDAPLHYWMDLMHWDVREVSHLKGVKDELLIRLKSQEWSPPHLMSFKNGTLNSSTQHFQQDHKKENFLTHCFNFNYQPEAICPIWQKFLQETFNQDEQVIQLLRAAFRWSATPKDTSRPFELEVFFDLYGPKGCGKGTLLEVLQAVCGGEQATGTARTTTFSNPTQLAALIGKKIAVDMDSSGHIGDVGIFNSIVSNELVTIKILYVNETSTRLGVVLWRAYNDLPSVSGGGQEGLGRRMVTFRIEHSAKQPDNTLKKRLLDEIEGIFQWCWSMPEKDMYEALRRRGEVKAITEASLANALDHSPHIRFIIENYLDGVEEIKASYLYEKYKCWCNSEGIKGTSQTNFGKQIKKLPIVEGYRKDVGNFYKIGAAKDFDVAVCLGIKAANEGFNPPLKTTLQTNLPSPKNNWGNHSQESMEGMQGLSNKFELKKENNSSYIKKDSDKTLQTIQTMQNDGICSCTEMVEAARDEGNYSIEEILNWIKSYGKDITKTEIERSLEKLRVTHEGKDQTLKNIDIHHETSDGCH